MRKYTFPARREDIERCYDIEQLRAWKQQFDAVFNQIEADHGGLENVPERIYRYVRANELNLKQLDFKIRKLTGPVSSVGALKCFHDTMKDIMPNEYGYVVEQAKVRLFKQDMDWNDLIKPRR